MVRRLLALLLAAALLLPGTGTASIAWKENTPAQKLLKEYIENVNTYLIERGEQEINTRFEMYDQFAVLGITSAPGAETRIGNSTLSGSGSGRLPSVHRLISEWFPTTGMFAS